MHAQVLLQSILLLGAVASPAVSPASRNGRQYQAPNHHQARRRQVPPPPPKCPDAVEKFCWQDAAPPTPGAKLWFITCTAGEWQCSFTGAGGDPLSTDDVAAGAACAADLDGQRCSNSGKYIPGKSSSSSPSSSTPAPTAPTWPGATGWNGTATSTAYWATGTGTGLPGTAITPGTGTTVPTESTEPLPGPDPTAYPSPPLETDAARAPHARVRRALVDEPYWRNSTGPFVPGAAGPTGTGTGIVGTGTAPPWTGTGPYSTGTVSIGFYPRY